MTKIELVIASDDENLVDPGHSSGLTEPGFDALMGALTRAGFEIDSGPDKVEE